MSIENLQPVGSILDKIKEKEGLSTDIELAEFLGRKPGTISAWRTRETLDWELILTKCSDYINELLYGEMRINDPQEEYGELRDSEFEQYSVELIKKVEESPFSQSAKLRIIDSLIRILRNDMHEQ